MTVELLSSTENPIWTCAIAASMCYDSTPSYNTVKGCIKSGHCYDEETEVLTEQGFKKWKDVVYEDRLATVNPEDRTFNGFENPIALIQYDYCGPMYTFNSKTIDLCITPGHKLYCSLNNTQENRINPKFKLRSANEIIHCTNGTPDAPLYKKPIRMATSAINNNLRSGNPFYKFAGFFIGDGHLENENTGYVSFHLKKDRKIKYLRQICEECGIELKELSNNKFVCYVKGMECFYNNNKEKTFPHTYLSMSKEDFEYFYEGLINSDGCIQKTSIQYETTSIELVNKLQALFSINNVVHTIIKKTHDNFSWKDSYTINISQSTLKYPMFNDSRSKKYSEEILYRGKVYCAEVSTGLLIIRRNNKVCLCGNCSVLEHASFTFRITGVSRSLLAQLTRHRLASFSVQSQRYCSYAETDVSFVMPGNDKYLNGEILESAHDSLAAYNQIIAHGHSPENARAVLPNCMPTSLCMTVNLRELATICNQRLCAHAQAEIRQLFAAIKRTLLDSPKFSDEDKEIFRLLLVPKCETHPVPYCTEAKSCHKYKYLTELIK